VGGGRKNVAKIDHFYALYLLYLLAGTSKRPKSGVRTIVRLGYVSCVGVVFSTETTHTFIPCDITISLGPVLY